MKLVKKVSVGGEYAKKGEDILDGDELTIKNAGETVEGKFGEQLVFKVETRNGERNLNLNQKSQNNLIDAYGDDTDNWVGKKVIAHMIKTMVQGKLTNVVYLAHPGWLMDDEGNFEPDPTKINPEDIPF